MQSCSHSSSTEAYQKIREVQEANVVKNILCDTLNIIDTVCRDDLEKCLIDDVIYCDDCEPCEVDEEVFSSIDDQNNQDLMLADKENKHNL